MQATLEAITEDLDKLRSEALLPALEAGLNEQQLQAFFHGARQALVLTISERIEFSSRTIGSEDRGLLLSCICLSRVPSGYEVQCDYGLV